MSIIEYKNTDKGGYSKINSELINILKALAHENRLRLLNLLQQEELCVCELRNIMEINQSNASRHLAKLRAAKLVKYQQKEQWVYYGVNQDIYEEYPFLEPLINDEVKKLECCQDDRERLFKYRESGLSCEGLDESVIFNKSLGGN